MRKQRRVKGQQRATTKLQFATENTDAKIWDKLATRWLSLLNALLAYLVQTIVYQKTAPTTLWSMNLRHAAEPNLQAWTLNYLELDQNRRAWRLTELHTKKLTFDLLISHEDFVTYT